MELLIISTVDFNKHGIPIAILNNYRNFDHQKIHCTFIVNESIDREFAEEIMALGDQIHVLPNRKKHTFVYINRLHKIAEDGHFDIAHIHGNSATMLFEILALKGTCKIICQAHTTGGIHSLINKILYPPFIRMTEFCAACSEEAGEFLFKKKSFEVLNNGIDSQRYLFDSKVRKDVREKYGINSQKVILHVGSFNDQKNQPFLIDAFEMLANERQDVVLWLVGVGQDMNDIRKMVESKRMEKRVKFIGRVNNVWDYMMAADCFVLPSKVESFGIVNIEAQAAGLPCIISDVVPKKVKLTKNVEFVPLSSGVQVWVKKITKFLDGTLSDAERKNANQIVGKSTYDINITSKQLQDYYAKIMTTNK